MTEKELVDLKKIVFITAEYYGKTISSEVVRMRASDLQDLNFEDVRRAYETYRRDTKNKFDPLPAQIREIIFPVASDEAQANEAAARIWHAISRYGHTNSESAQEYIGEVGWLVVHKLGGWNTLCQSLKEGERGMFLAQARNLAKAQIELAKAGKLDKGPELPQLNGAKPKFAPKIGDLVRLGLNDKEN